MSDFPDLAPEPPDEFRRRILRTVGEELASPEPGPELRDRVLGAVRREVRPRRIPLVLAAAAALLLVTSAMIAAVFLRHSSGEASLGSKERPFSMYFAPSVEPEAVARTAGDIASYVSRVVSRRLYGRDEGFYVKGQVPPTYAALVEAIGRKEADFAALTTYSYILAKDIKACDIEAEFTVLHGDHGRTYRGEIIARADRGIRRLEDFNGRSFAYVDPASTTGFILPSKLFKDRGVAPGETSFAQTHDNVVLRVYRGEVDGGAVFSDARARLKARFPDVFEKVVVIGETGEVPNEPWVLRSTLDPRVKEAVREALLGYAETAAGKANLARTYNVTGLAPADDRLYAHLRKALFGLGLDIEALAYRSEPFKKAGHEKEF